MDGDIVLRLLELAEPGASFEDAGGRRILRDAADEILAARACAEMMLQGTGQKLGEELARRVMDEHYPPRWIPVGERLPEEGVVVLAYLPKQADVESGVYAAMLSKLQTLRGTFSTSFGFGFEATHWMPLPEPPEVK